MNKISCPCIGTGGGEFPEGRAEVEPFGVNTEL